MFTASFDHPFGDYALALYGRSEVCRCCLQWQDELGMDVNLLLWASWLDSQGLMFEEAVWLAGCARVKRLREWGIKPLRAIRRSVKAWAKVYGLMKRIELWVEAIAMKRLYRLTQGNSLIVLLKSDEPHRDHARYSRHYLESLHADDRIEHWVKLIGLEK